MFEVTAVPAFQDNYIWMLTLPDSNKAIAVDPGDAQPVENWLGENNKQLAGILVTHHHHDHTGGIIHLTTRRKIPVYGANDSACERITHPLSDGDSFELLGQTFQVTSTPGHTLDHLSFLHDGDIPQLFCGDTLFLAGCGRLFEGTAAQMQAAMDFYASLPSATEVYCTHEYSLANLRFAAAVEPYNEAIKETIAHCERLREEGRPTLPSRITLEKRVNPFMRSRVESVIEAAAQQSGESLTEGEPTLAVLRAWKDNF